MSGHSCWDEYDKILIFLTVNLQHEMAVQVRDARSVTAAADVFHQHCKNL